MFSILYPRRMFIVFRINDKYLFLPGKHKIRLHHRKHITGIRIQLPENLRCIYRKLRMLFPVILQNKLLIKPAHSLFIYKLHQLHASICRRLQQSFQHQAAYGYQHTIRLIIPCILLVPINGRKLKLLYIRKENQELPDFLFPQLVNISMKKLQEGGFNDSIPIGIH